MYHNSIEELLTGKIVMVYRVKYHYEEQSFRRTRLYCVSVCERIRITNVSYRRTCKMLKYKLHKETI